MMPPVSRRFVLTGAALTTASLLVPITVRAGRAAESYEITDWIVIAPVCRQSISDSRLGNLRECLAHLV
jgi:hypothetical protein